MIFTAIISGRGVVGSCSLMVVETVPEMYNALMPFVREGDDFLNSKYRYLLQVRCSSVQGSVKVCKGDGERSEDANDDDIPSVF